MLRENYFAFKNTHVHCICSSVFGKLTLVRSGRALSISVKEVHRCLSLLNQLEIYTARYTYNKDNTD